MTSDSWRLINGIWIEWILELELHLAVVQECLTDSVCLALVWPFLLPEDATLLHNICVVLVPLSIECLFQVHCWHCSASDLLHYSVYIHVPPQTERDPPLKTKPVTGWPIFRLLSRLEYPGQLWLKGQKGSMVGKGWKRWNYTFCRVSIVCISIESIQRSLAWF